MTQKEKERQKEVILSRLPREARFVVRSDSRKQEEIDKIVKQIYEQHGKELSALAKH
ncbi:MAG TPA: hypothetical protein VJL27_02495 [Patescibacteria group bacterium]|nr:hypothetical protein [Patescibacteria group bacterium]